MIKTATILMGAVAALSAAAAFAPSSYAQSLSNDQAYCRQLIDEYTFRMPRSQTNESLSTSVAIDQCRSGNAEPAIPVLEKMMRDRASRSRRWRNGSRSSCRPAKDGRQGG